MKKLFIFSFLALCFILCFSAQVSAGLTDNLLSYYKLEETSGNLIDELLINNLTNSNGATQGATGKINYGVSFDGNNDALDVTTTNSGQNGSFAGWVYIDSLTSATGSGTIFCMNQDTDASNNYISLIQNSITGKLSMISGGGNSVSTTTWAFTEDNWYHIAVTTNGTNYQIYVNGTAQDLTRTSGDGDWSADITGFNHWSFGALTRGSQTYDAMLGTLDEIGIWNRTLTPTEILELYNSGTGFSYPFSSAPKVTLESPANGTTISDVGTNFTVSGNNLTDVSGTWENLTYYVWENNTLVNATTVLITGETFNQTQFIDDFTFNDYEWNAEACYTNVTGTYCIEAAANFTFTVSLYTIISESYVNDTVSGTLENFSISIDILQGYSLSNATFMYNSTGTSPSITAEGDNRFLLVSDYQIPILLTDENTTLYWNFGFSNGQSLNTTERTQLIRTVLLDNCSTYTYQIFNISLFDEELKTALLGDIEITYSLLNMPAYQTINTYSFEKNNISNVGVCSGINLSAESLAYSAEIRYVADDYAPELYHIQRAEIGSGIQSINLYDLHNNESTEFKVTYQDDTFNFVDGAIIQLQRKYISEGSYEVVEAPLTSRDGVAVLHVDLNSIKYRATVVKNGVVLDVFDNLVFKCESELTGECTQKLLGDIDPENSQEVSNLIDFSYVISSVNNTITTTFTIPSGTPSVINILLTQVDSFGSNTMCNTTVTSSAGSIDCDYNATIGDSRVFLTITKDGVIYVNQGYFIPENTNLGFAGNNYLIVLLLLFTLVGMAFASPEWIVIIGIVAFVVAGGLWLINGMNIVIGLGMMMFVIIAAAVLIMKMTKQEDR